MFHRALWVCVFLPGLAIAEPMTLPTQQRPQWLERDGIVMAGSWEPLMFRVRRDGSPGYTPTAQQQADYLREHSPEMIARLKGLGVNFVMMHCHKGGGLQAERQSMADAARFARLCHDNNLRVGVYVTSGTLIWDLLFKEVPQAENWVVRDEKGRPLTYGPATYRYFWDRCHPEAAAYEQQIVRFAVEQIGTDLLHFDNHNVGPGWDANSVSRFRRDLREKFTPVQLREMGIAEIDTATPPTADSPPLLRHAWADFCCRSLADAYRDMARYARGLRSDILMECNPGGPGLSLHPPVDHGRLMQGGEACWDEGQGPGYRKGKLYSRIRSYKIGRVMDNSVFCYTTTPLEMAESMAFNRDCLGAVCWFEYGRIVTKPGLTTPMAAAELAPSIRFFHQRRDLLRGAGVVADAAVLRSFPSQVFADAKWHKLTADVEEALIQNRAPFQIIFDHHLANLKPYRALVLAGCVALSDPQVAQIRRYVAAGGRLCVIGPAATHDGWMRPRVKPALDDLPPASVVRIAEKGDFLAAVARACQGRLSLAIEAPPGLCAELTGQPQRRLLHLVNYRSDAPAKDIAVRLELPAGKRVATVRLASPGRENDLEVPYEQHAASVSFRVPEVSVYEIAVVTMQ